MDLASKPISQKATIRQLKIDNLRQQAQIRMLINIVVSSANGPTTWDRETINMIMSADSDERFERRKKMMLEICTDQVLDSSPLAAGLTDQERAEVNKF